MMVSTDSVLLFRLLADAVLLVHLAFVVFVVVGLVLIVAGNLRHWNAVNGFGFRVAHVAAIGVVVLQSWLGQACPLTLLESWLRVRAGGTAYGSGFVEHWVHRILFYEGPEWLFTIAYSLFGLLVALAWWYFPPRRRRS
jgi:hypothetical protein